ncbi:MULTISPECIES: hypothetical protein [Brevundimonas]|jgi:hypothetical protein|uniref:hypothetical protein n=1 Tax=Brevundimonas sp. UBA7507 TaxID=1946137 RepID=UPI00257D295B|nr:MULTISPECIES: hypothetical protein [Brevundimonas]
MQKQRFSKLKALGLIALVIVSPLAGAGAAFALSNWNAGVFGGAFAVAGLTSGFLMRLPRVQAALRLILPQTIE